MNTKIIKMGALCAVATAGYISGIASFLFNIEHIFKNSGPDTVFAPILMLLLFVISAGVTGFAVFGVPLMWYIDGEKHEAVKLLGCTILFLAIIALLLIMFL